MHLPCGEVPSSAFHAAPLPLAVVVALAGPLIPAALMVAVVRAMPVVASVAATGVQTASVQVGDTWAAAGTWGAGTCRGPTRREGTMSSKASVPGPSSSASSRTAHFWILLRPLLLAFPQNVHNA